MADFIIKIRCKNCGAWNKSLPFNKYDTIESGDFDKPILIRGAEGEKQPIRCPICNSDNIYVCGRKPLNFITRLLYKQ